MNVIGIKNSYYSDDKYNFEHGRLVITDQTIPISASQAVGEFFGSFGYCKNLYISWFPDDAIPHKGIGLINNVRSVARAVMDISPNSPLFEVTYPMLQKDCVDHRESCKYGNISDWSSWWSTCLNCEDCDCSNKDGSIEWRKVPGEPGLWTKYSYESSPYNIFSIDASTGEIHGGSSVAEDHLAADNQNLAASQETLAAAILLVKWQRLQRRYNASGQTNPVRSILRSRIDPLERFLLEKGYVSQDKLQSIEQAITAKHPNR